jgi:hypothetical protein
MVTNGVARPLAPATVGELGVPVKPGDEDLVARVLPHLAGVDGSSPGLEAADRLRQVIAEFATPPGQTPGGFRAELPLRRADGTLVVDLVRDIGRHRPPNYLARWTSRPQVVSYPRRVMRAARHANDAQQASRLAGELQDITV